MRRKFQEGGSARALPLSLQQLEEELTTFPLEGDEDGISVSPMAGGALDPSQLMLMSISEMFGNTTTPEAQARAQGILDDYMNRDESSWDAILQGKRDQAAKVRAALQVARDRLNAQEYNRGEMLLAASQALGAPTRTGTIGETASNVFGALREPLAKRREFERGRDDALTRLDLLDANADEGVTEAEFLLHQLRERIQGNLAVEALDTLGKRTGSSMNALGKIIPEGAQALDREYVKEYLPWIGGGGAKAAQGLEALGFAADVLERGVNDAISGPYAGAIAKLPFVGRWLQAYTSPEGADVRDLIELTIQESLRPILGSQFTREEGERLIERTYNTSLEEWRNARRIRALHAQLSAAHKSKQAMADYYGQNYTLFGLDPNSYAPVNFGSADDLDLTIDEQPPPEVVEFSSMPPGPEKELALQLWMENNPGRQPPEWMIEGVRRARGGRVGYKRGGRVRKRYQEGGFAFNEPGAERETTLSEDLKNLWAEYGDPVGMGIGALGGLTLGAGVDTFLNRRIGGTERRVADAISSGGLDPEAVAEDIKRNRRAGVPETLMDTDTAGIRSLAEEAFKWGDGPAEQALRELRTRVEQSRDRTTNLVNQGLRPDDYFDEEDKISQRLANEHKEAMTPIFEQYKEIPADPVLSEILKTPEGQQAAEYAMRFYTNRPGSSPGVMDEKGNLVQPTLEFYDHVRRGLNRGIAQVERGGDTELGGVLRDLRTMYLGRLDELAPEYQTARTEAGDDLALRDRLRQGREFMKYQPQELDRMAKEMTFMERDAFRTGMAQRLYETLDKPSAESFQSAQRVVGSPGTMERLRPFFDSNSQFNMFQLALEREAELFRTGRETLKVGEAARHARESSRQSPFEYTIRKAGGFRTAVSPMGWTLRLLYDIPKMTPKEAADVLSVLRRGTPEEMNAFANRVRRLNRYRSRPVKWGRRAAGAALGAGVGALLGNDPEPQE